MQQMIESRGDSYSPKVCNLVFNREKESTGNSRGRTLTSPPGHRSNVLSSVRSFQ